MKVTFVSHASILIEIKNTRILCDPWLVGKAFNDGWALVSPPHEISFSEVDYIWISHEHPDHFNFSTLKMIPVKDKKRIRVLYQNHSSKRLVRALKGMGFEHVVELPLYRWFSLTPKIDLYCGSIGSVDSFLAVRDDTACLLNLNDCPLNRNQIRYVKEEIGEITILFTQFSFAQWVGNEHDELGGAERKCRELSERVSLLTPKVTVPFANFAYFCNQENSRMNAWVNTPEKISELNLNGVNFMYPGDRWESAVSSLDSAHAIKRYMEDFNSRALSIQSIDSTPTQVDIDTICKAVDDCMAKLRQRFSARVLRRMGELDIYLHNLNKVLTINLGDGSHVVLDMSEDLAEQSRFVMCSQVAWYLFAYSWGGSTLEVSGMYIDRLYATQGRHKFFFYQNLLCTEVVDLSNAQGARRTFMFFWRKKWELWYRLLGRVEFLIRRAA